MQTTGTTVANGQRPASRLAKAQRGRMSMPLRYVIYGAEGVGKTSLAAGSPAPIWLDIEDGSSRVDVARYTFRDEPGGHVPREYSEILSAIDDLTLNEHAYQTLVIDTADRLEALMWSHLTTRDKKGSIEDYGFGKGYNMAVEEWRALCSRLDRMRLGRRMSVIVLAHAQIRTFKNPEGEDFDRWQLRIHDKAAGFLKEWSDMTAFACFEQGGAKLDKTGRAKGFSTGRRLLKTMRTAMYDAKSRYAMPDEIEMDAANPWAPFARAVNDGTSMPIADILALIEAETTRIGDPTLTEKVAAASDKAAKANEAETLHRFLNDLKRREAAKAA